DSRGFDRRCWSFPVVARNFVFAIAISRTLAPLYLHISHLLTFRLRVCSPARLCAPCENPVPIAGAPCPGSLWAAGALGRTPACRCRTLRRDDPPGYLCKKHQPEARART